MHEHDIGKCDKCRAIYELSRTPDAAMPEDITKHLGALSPSEREELLKADIQKFSEKWKGTPEGKKWLKGDA